MNLTTYFPQKIRFSQMTVFAQTLHLLPPNDPINSNITFHLNDPLHLDDFLSPQWPISSQWPIWSQRPKASLRPISAELLFLLLTIYFITNDPFSLITHLTFRLISLNRPVSAPLTHFTPPQRPISLNNDLFHSNETFQPHYPFHQNKIFDPINTFNPQPNSPNDTLHSNDQSHLNNLYHSNVSNQPKDICRPNESF